MNLLGHCTMGGRRLPESRSLRRPPARGGRPRSDERRAPCKQPANSEAPRPDRRRRLGRAQRDPRGARPVRGSCGRARTPAVPRAARADGAGRSGRAARRLGGSRVGLTSGRLLPELQVRAGGWGVLTAPPKRIFIYLRGTLRSFIRSFSSFFQSHGPCNAHVPVRECQSCIF